MDTSNRRTPLLSGQFAGYNSGEMKDLKAVTIMLLNLSEQ